MAEQHVYSESEVTGRKITSKDSDVLLGVVAVPLKQLLTHKTGKDFETLIYQIPIL